MALEYKQKADELASKLLSNPAIDDPHTHHISCRGQYYFIDKWIKNRDEKKQKLRELITKLEAAIRSYPRDKKLDQALGAVNRAYLNLGINTSELPSPDISN